MSAFILIAEDDVDLRQIVADFLRAWGFETAVVTTGLETLDQIAKRQPDLLILDLSMPLMDGWEVIKHLRSVPATHDFPIVAFTAHALAGVEARARAAGCNGFITKPFNPGDLLGEIQRLLPTPKVN